MKKKKLVLFEWDGTISKGFTLLRWIKYLYVEGVVDKSVTDQVEILIKCYYEGGLSHNQLSLMVAEHYAQNLTGKSAVKVNELSLHFFKTDRQLLFHYSLDLFSQLKIHNIDAMFICGAPLPVLRHYQSWFGFTYFHCLDLECQDGIFVGDIRSNYDLAQYKQLAVDTIDYDTYDVVAAFGNSEADMPLFKASPLNIIVNNPTLAVPNRAVYVTGREIEYESMKRFLEREILTN
jgi:phosphoserine phosphatase